MHPRLPTATRRRGFKTFAQFRNRSISRKAVTTRSPFYWRPGPARPGSFLDGQPTSGKEQIQVRFGSLKPENFTPASTTGFNEITIALKITASGTHTLSFVGLGISGNGTLGTGEFAGVLIDEVSIKPTLPKISSGPSDLDPTSKIKLTRSHFGTDKGKFRIHFHHASDVSFGSKSSNSKDDLILDVDGAWVDDGTITFEQILAASPVGSVPEQQVDITAIAADGQVSNVVHATFHNKAVITSGPKTISYFPKVPLKGWASTKTQALSPSIFPKSRFRNLPLRTLTPRATSLFRWNSRSGSQVPWPYRCRRFKASSRRTTWRFGSQPRTAGNQTHGRL